MCIIVDRQCKYITHTRLNTPVTQEKKAEYCGGAMIAAQKYGPPLVGIADVISAMPSPTNIVKKFTTIHPIDMTPGPPTVRPYWKRVVMPVTTLYEVLCCQLTRSTLVCGDERYTTTYNDGKGNTKVVHHTPFSLQLFLVSKICKGSFVPRSYCSSSFSCGNTRNLVGHLCEYLTCM